ncbi:FkbM family methyltransferase [Roseovarius sp. SK2]|jgi:FkbM family methyltransferase|uniref:FkbM family methyltransferase n=1 Tax=Roseovarius TaxID=74030 RepID=UPI00237B9DA6|nr:FkbM family methyltransferase [Roseovarius sp. SK2]MDD9728263.1 FkbM family methyltransferase [Roseovarius sp. SK2]
MANTQQKNKRLIFNSERHFKRNEGFQNFVMDLLRYQRTMLAMRPKSIDTRDKDDVAQFLSFAIEHADRAEGQLFQDVWALWEHGLESPGFFVEFGAANGKKLSNTYLLETAFSWSGIVAEPNPEFIPQVRENRNCIISEKCVFSESGKQVAFLPASYGELSRMKDIAPEDSHEASGSRDVPADKEVLVETISLNDLLVENAAPSTIDFMSIDTEGSEFEILSKFDFDRWDVRSLCVEHNYTPLREKLYDLLTSHGSVRKNWESVTRFDDWYVKP